MNYIAFPIALSYSFNKEDFFRFGGLALLVVLIGISLFVLILARKGHNRKKESERHDYNVRLYRRNRLTKEFYCVDKKDLTNQKIFTQEEFLHQFAPSDKLRVKAWIDSISRGDYEEYFSAEIRLNKANRTCPTIREVTVLIRPHTGFTLNPILSRILRAPIRIRARLSISSVQIITLSRKRKTQENSLLPLPRKAWVPSSLSRYSPIPS